ncbi:hypothetical protein PCE1_000043 [Barthelona sp. PCE]
MSGLIFKSDKVHCRFQTPYTINMLHLGNNRMLNYVDLSGKHVQITDISNPPTVKMKDYKTDLTPIFFEREGLRDRFSNDEHGNFYYRKPYICEDGSKYIIKCSFIESNFIESRIRIPDEVTTILTPVRKGYVVVGLEKDKEMNVISLLNLDAETLEGRVPTLDPVHHSWLGEMSNCGKNFVLPMYGDRLYYIWYRLPNFDVHVMREGFILEDTPYIASMDFRDNNLRSDEILFRLRLISTADIFEEDYSVISIAKTGPKSFLKKDRNYTAHMKFFESSMTPSAFFSEGTRNNIDRVAFKNGKLHTKQHIQFIDAAPKMKTVDSFIFCFREQEIDVYNEHSGFLEGYHPLGSSELVGLLNNIPVFSNNHIIMLYHKGWDVTGIRYDDSQTTYKSGTIPEFCISKCGKYLFASNANSLVMFDDNLSVVHICPPVDDIRFDCATVVGEELFYEVYFEVRRYNLKTREVDVIHHKKGTFLFSFVSEEYGIMMVTDMFVEFESQEFSFEFNIYDLATGCHVGKLNSEVSVKLCNLSRSRSVWMCSEAEIVFVVPDHVIQMEKIDGKWGVNSYPLPVSVTQYDSIFLCKDTLFVFKKEEIIIIRWNSVEDILAWESPKTISLKYGMSNIHPYVAVDGEHMVFSDGADVHLVTITSE